MGTEKITTHIMRCDHRHCDAEVIGTNAIIEATECDWLSFIATIDAPFEATKRKQTFYYCPKHAMTAYNMGIIDSEPVWAAGSE